MYKLSIYSTAVENKYGHIILYNSLLGTKSICKLIDSENINLFINKNYECMSSSVVQALVLRGILVDELEDEYSKLLSKFYDFINPKELHLTINITEKCNFRCIYCYETFSKGSMQFDTMNKLVEFVKKNIIHFSGLRISWFGGEPLLAVDKLLYLSEQFIKICKFYKRSYSSDITTNGSLLNEEIFSKLLSKRVLYYQITIDGTKEIHDIQRVFINGYKTFDIIIKNLIGIKNNKTRNFKITLRTNFTKEIYDKFDEYISLIDFFCKNDERFNVSLYKVGDWGASLNTEYKEKLISSEENFMKKIYEKIYESNLSVNLNLNILQPGSGLCYGGKKHNYVISASGTCHKCTILFENIDSIIGELDDKGNILLNNKYYNLISDYTKCRYFSKCNVAPICLGDPCPYKKPSDSRCLFIKNNLDIILKIIDKNSNIVVI